MIKTLPMSNSATAAKLTAFGSFIDPARETCVLPGMVFVELDVPEYDRNGLGRMIAKTLAYDFSDAGQHCSVAVSVGADASRSHVIYEDMNPLVWGKFAEIFSKNSALARELQSRHYGPEMVVVGVISASRMELDFNRPDDSIRLFSFLETYYQRATWMELNILEVHLANAQALAGESIAFEWDQIFPPADAGEVQLSSQF